MSAIGILSYKQTKLENSNIRYNDYLRSLLSELDRLGLVSAVETARVRMSVMDALGEIINIRTDGESSSVMTETANELMMSMLFNIDAYLIGLGSIDAAVNAMLDTPAIELYYRGQRRLKLYICEATGLLVKVKRSRLSLPNVYYNETIDHSLMSALKSYDIRFGAHKVDGDIDYPLAVQSNSLRGIHYLRGYLLSLLYENTFCREYGAEEISKLYALFCDRHKYPYSEPRVNIYSIVFINAVFNEYMRKEPGVLSISEDECEVMEELLNSMNNEERRNALTGIAAKLIGGNTIYNIRTASRFMPEMLNAVRKHTLKNYLTCTL